LRLHVDINIHLVLSFQASPLPLDTLTFAFLREDRFQVLGSAVDILGVVRILEGSRMM
jgi:hypothetical protein